MKKRYKIFAKLFILTALTFTTLLICVLFIQSYFYQKTYRVYKEPALYNANRKLRLELKEIKKEAFTPDGLTELSEKYWQEYEVQFAVFLPDQIQAVYQRDEKEAQTGWPIDRAVMHFEKYIPMLMDERTNFGGEYTDEETDAEYSVLMTPFDDPDGVVYCLLVMGLYPGADVVVGLVDRFLVYIAAAGVMVSILLSYILSSMISRPLVNLNTVAKNMAGLDFSKKSSIRSKDELGELSDSLNFLSESLDKTIGELTIANKKLEDDIEKERRLEKTRKEFVANVSHELKTPVAIIKGYGEALKDNIRADKKEHYINQILMEADYMNSLVQDMLDLSKIEAGRYKPDITRFDLITLARHIGTSLLLSARSKNIKICYDIPDSDIYIEADRLKIGQVMTNFITNAIRHSPQNGSIRIIIQNAATEETAPDMKNRVLFAVENEGGHISPELRDKVWDRFFRVEEARNRKTGGTGLGLAISAGILEMHKMDYGAENTETGIRFYFRVGTPENGL